MAAVQRMVDDPTTLVLAREVLRDFVVALEPASLHKLCGWQRCVRPSPESEKLFHQIYRVVRGRQYRKSVLPGVSVFRKIDFGSGLVLLFAENHPASHAFMHRVMPATGVHEPELVHFLQRTLRHGDFVVDLGAHAGYVSCVAAALGASVLAVEMQATLIPIIQANAAVNELWNVHTLCAAIGDRSGLVPSMRTDPSPGLQATVGHWERGQYPLTSANHDLVPSMTLDSLFPVAPYPTLVKVDVEGAEARVLAGAKRLIAAGRTAFMVEVHAHLLGSMQNTLADITNCFPAERWTLSILTPEGTEPLSRETFLDPEGPIARHVHNAPVLFEPVRA